MLEVRLIGTFEVRFEGGTIVLSSRAAQSLFAYLILTAGTKHRREKLAGMFWPDAPEEKARAYLRYELWRIRKALPKNPQIEYLVADDMTLSFNATAAYWLDVDLLKRLEERASVDQLAGALAAYQGELLPGFYEDWAMEERGHLHVLFETWVGRLLARLEKEKRWEEMIRWAEHWIEVSEMPETAYRFLMAAYDELGQRAKAASTYERYVKALRALDLEPSEEIRALAAKRSARVNLPIPLTSFIGRENELKEIAERLERSRLVTLTGSGGVGKTRLAIQVVAEVMGLFPDGIWFLDLASLSDPAYLPTTVATVLGLLERGDPRFSVLDRLIDYFSTRKTLLIFDNCEHLIVSCARLVHSLLTACASLSILATSREALRVPGEIPYRVPSLDLPVGGADDRFETLLGCSSVRLFVERAAGVSPHFVANPQNISAVASICRRLDGIPLAIELAAARTDVLTVEQISGRLDDCIHLLTHGLRSAPLRHETLRATIEWSVQLLSDRERLLFTRLAVFVGGWSLEAAEAICSGEGLSPAEILDLLTSLVNKSLVIVEGYTPGRYPPGGEAYRYHSLETIRQYAQERLLADAQADSLRDRHLEYYLRISEESEPFLVGDRQSEWMDYLEAELDNIRLALDWAIHTARAEPALRLFGALGWFWLVHCRFQEGIQWFGRARDLPGEVSKSVKAKALGHVGVLFWVCNSIPASREALQESIELYRVLGNKWELSNRILSLGVAEAGEGDLEQAHAHFEQALTISREIGHGATMTRALFNLADISRRQGDRQAAAPLYEESLLVCRRQNDDHLTTMVLLNVGDFALGQGEYSKSREYYQEALEISLALKNKRVTALSLVGFADILCALGVYSQSARLQGFSVRLLKELGVKPVVEEMLSYQKTAGLLSQAMGRDSYDRELEAGRALSLDQAIQITLDLVP